MSIFFAFSCSLNSNVCLKFPLIQIEPSVSEHFSYKLPSASFCQNNKKSFFTFDFTVQHNGYKVESLCFFIFRGTLAGTIDRDILIELLSSQILGDCGSRLQREFHKLRPFSRNL